MGQIPSLSQATIEEIDNDAHSHVPSAVHTSYGGALPFSLGLLINALLPYLLKAVEALIANGIPTPTTGQVIAKAAELRAAEGP